MIDRRAWGARTFSGTDSHGNTFFYRCGQFGCTGGHDETFDYNEPATIPPDDQANQSLGNSDDDDQSLGHNDEGDENLGTNEDADSLSSNDDDENLTGDGEDDGN
jgi:hypothetical protein